MEINDIKNIFKDRKRRSFEYAVLAPLIEVNNVPSLLYQVRSGQLKRQPGEISFPGGRIEEGENPRLAAIRETNEEMGIDKDNIEIIGQLDSLLDSRNNLIYPILGQINNINFDDINFFKDEVAEVFTVPIDFFINNKPEIYEMSYKMNEDGSFPFHKIPNGTMYQTRTLTYPVYLYEYNNYVIWGLTAKITFNFIKELIKKIPRDQC